MIKILYTLLILTLFTLGNEKPTLTIYTYDAFAVSWGPGPKIKEAFEKEHDCHVKFVGLSSSIGALRKVQLEGRSTKADIVLGLDTNIAQAAKKTGLFAKHGLDTSNLDLPIAYADEYFVPFDYSYVAFVYDSEKLKDPPTSFEALAAMPEDFKIVIQDPRSSTPGLSLLLWVKEIYKENAGEYWKRLAPHILTITKGWSESYGLFLKGEADMVLSYTTSPAYHIIEEKRTNFKSARFNEGHYGQIEVAAMLNSSKHKGLAKQFLHFMHSETFAEIIPTANWAYPVVKTKQGLPEVFERLTQPSRMILLDGKTVESQRKEIINEWLQALER